MVFFHICKTNVFEGGENNVHKIKNFFFKISTAKQTLKTSVYFYKVNTQCQHSMNFVLNSVGR